MHLFEWFSTAMGRGRHLSRQRKSGICWFIWVTMSRRSISSTSTEFECVWLLELLDHNHNRARSFWWIESTLEVMRHLNRSCQVFWQLDVPQWISDVVCELLAATITLDECQNMRSTRFRDKNRFKKRDGHIQFIIFCLGILSARRKVPSTERTLLSALFWAHIAEHTLLSALCWLLSPFCLAYFA